MTTHRCVICFDDLDTQECTASPTVRHTPIFLCAHGSMMHARCAATWAVTQLRHRERPSCPVCRASMPTALPVPAPSVDLRHTRVDRARVPRRPSSVPSFIEQCAVRMGARMLVMNEFAITMAVCMMHFIHIPRMALLCEVCTGLISCILGIRATALRASTGSCMAYLMWSLSAPIGKVIFSSCFRCVQQMLTPMLVILMLLFSSGQHPIWCMYYNRLCFGIQRFQMLTALALAHF